MMVGGVAQNGLWCENWRGFSLKVFAKEVRDMMNSLGSTKGRFPCWYKVAGACPEETNTPFKIRISQHEEPMVHIEKEYSWDQKINLKDVLAIIFFGS